MHNMLTTIWVAVLFCILMSYRSAEADSLKTAPLLLPVKNGTAISVSQSGKKIVARFSGERKGRPVSISNKLASEFLSSEETRLLLDLSTGKTSQYVVLSRRLSNPKNRTGYCGAGYEDNLLLLNVAKNQISLVDTFLLQSCLSLKTLYSKSGADTLADPSKGITVDKEKRVINFEWLKDEQGYVWTLYIENNQFLLR